MELDEIRGEVAEELTKENQERWMSWLALSTVILAVCATLSSFWEGNNSVDTVLYQTQAANKWSHYQAKSIKSYLYEIQIDKLKLEASVAPADSPIIEGYKKQVNHYEGELTRYEAEKKDLGKEAKKSEDNRDAAQNRAEIFGMAVVFLQMGILLSSVAALMKRRPLWYVGMAVGLFGVVYFARGAALFF